MSASFAEMKSAGHDEPTETVVYAEVVEELRAETDELRAELRESLDRYDSLMDQNWRPLFGGAWDDYEGPSLTQTKDGSKRNREMLLNVHVANGLRLIASYVWDGGIHYDGIPGARQGRGTNVQARIDNPVNQVGFFGHIARTERTATAYCDGITLYAGDEADYTIRAVPIGEITDDYRNPNQSNEIWAYQRSWTEYKLGGETVPRVEWIFANAFKDKEQGRSYLTYNGKRQSIAKSKRMFVKKVNSISGWAYGLADVTAAIPWAEQYRRLTMAGISMAESMAAIFATAKSNTKAGADAAGVRIAAMNGSGSIAHIGATNELQVMSSAGSSYKFADNFPVLANFAAGIGVSAISLSSNPGNAGGSYGASKSLEKPEQVSTNSRRQADVELDREVLIWLGADAEKLDVWFDPIKTEDELYRSIQANGLEWGFGGLESADLAKLNAQARGRHKPLPVPDGIMLPNNEKSLARLDIDADASAAASGGSFTPTQGSGAKTVQGGSGDQSSDDIRVRKESKRTPLNKFAPDADQW